MIITIGKATATVYEISYRQYNYTQHVIVCIHILYKHNTIMLYTQNVYHYDAKTLIYWDHKLCRLNSSDWQHTYTATSTRLLVYYCSYND